MEFGLFYTNVQQVSENMGVSEETVLCALTSDGMDYLECDWGVLRQKDETFFALLRSLRIGLSVYVFITQNGYLCADSTRYLGEEYERMYALGIRHVMTVYTASEDENAKSEKVADEIADSLQRLINLAENYGITITFEDFDDDVPIASCAELLRMGERVSALRFTFDTGNFQYHGEDVFACFDVLSDRIGHVHVKDRHDISHTARSCITGDGVLPLKELLSRLYQSGYRGALTAELFGAEPTVEAMLKGLHFVKDTYQAFTRG